MEWHGEVRAWHRTCGLVHTYPESGSCDGVTGEWGGSERNISQDVAQRRRWGHARRAGRLECRLCEHQRVGVHTHAAQGADAAAAGAPAEAQAPRDFTLSPGHHRVLPPSRQCHMPGVSRPIRAPVQGQLQLAAVIGGAPLQVQHHVLGSLACDREIEDCLRAGHARAGDCAGKGDAQRVGTPRGVSERNAEGQGGAPCPARPRAAQVRAVVSQHRQRNAGGRQLGGDAQDGGVALGARQRGASRASASVEAAAGRHLRQALPRVRGLTEQAPGNTGEVRQRE